MKRKKIMIVIDILYILGFLVFMTCDMYDIWVHKKQLTGNEAYLRTLIVIGFYHNIRNK